VRLKSATRGRVRRPKPTNPTSPRHHHFIGAPTTAINATTVPAAAPAFATGIAARHLMVFLKLLKFLSFPPPEGYAYGPGPCGPKPVLRVAPTARECVVTSRPEDESRLDQQTTLCVHRWGRRAVRRRAVDSVWFGRGSPFAATQSGRQHTDSTLQVVAVPPLWVVEGAARNMAAPPAGIRGAPTARSRSPESGAA
jgi:hypothetical protein